MTKWVSCESVYPRNHYFFQTIKLSNSFFHSSFPDLAAFVNTSKSVSITMSSSIYPSLSIYIWLSKRKVVIRKIFFVLETLLYNYNQLLNFYEKFTKNYWILPNAFVNFKISVSLSSRFKLFSYITAVANLTNSIEQQKR